MRRQLLVARKPAQETSKNIIRILDSHDNNTIQTGHRSGQHINTVHINKKRKTPQTNTHEQGAQTSAECPASAHGENENGPGFNTPVETRLEDSDNNEPRAKRANTG